MDGYCVIADLNEISAQRLIELTDDNDTGLVDEDIVTSLILKATNLINGYAKPRYSIPISPVPGLVKDLCAEITTYLLFCRRESVPEEWSLIYKSAISKLKDISTGRISLGSNEVQESEVEFTNKTVDDRIFKDPEGY
jgi:phage gp36-like protein